MSGRGPEIQRFDELIDSLDAVHVGSVDPERYETERLSEMVVALERVRTKLEAASLRFLKTWDRRRGWEADGARTGGAWLARQTTMDGSTAREKLRVAGSMDEMPATAEAFGDGEVSYTQLRQLQKVATDDDTKETFAKRERQLLKRVKDSPADETGRLLDAWRHRHTPRAGVAQDAKRRAKRSVRTWKDRHTGMGHLHAELAPEAWAKVRNTLQHVVDADWTRSHRSDAAASLPDDRTLPQRQADALETICDRALAMAGNEADYRAPQVQMIVNVDYDTLLAKAGSAVELGSREPLCGEAARRRACDAGISRHITKGDSLALDRGRTTRNPTPSRPRPRRRLHLPRLRRPTVVVSHPRHEGVVRRPRTHRRRPARRGL